MSYFQSTVLEKYLAAQHAEEIAEKFQQFQRQFQTPEKQDNIRRSKEEQYQEGFLRDLFVGVLDYTLNPEPNYNLITEQKNQTDSKKADGAILHQNEVIGVIELKGCDTTDLDKIVAQAFGYKNNHPKCRYVIIANFQRLRFYIDNTTEYLEFDLFSIDSAQFAQLYLCLAQKNLSHDLPFKIKSESLSAEEKITEQLYRDYSQFKRELFADLQANNPQYSKIELFQKSQKLLDRFLFIFFAEDRHLLPPNFIIGILNQWQRLKDEDVEIPLYQRIKQYFGYLDQGYTTAKGQEIFAYNGGLFKADSILDNIQISDQVLEPHIRRLSAYDFGSEIDVNILGHIFENSLNEIDEIHAELNGEKTDKKQTKRKKDGVFYTPRYITKYIVEHTVGRLCRQKKEQMGIKDEYYTEAQKAQTKTKQSRLKNLQDYREWLLQLTICDPACGSGAFLNEALNFLIAEHHYIDRLESKLAGGSIVYTNVELDILENNLYGVDINKESVEIAKLSLWLRTAQPRRKLNNLNKNIVCGNSLIGFANQAGGGNSQELPSEKTDNADNEPNNHLFTWQTAFPKVFKQGGFDVVIGNPPYGAKLAEKDIDFLCNAHGDQGLSKSLSDTYIAFYIVGLKHLTKSQGLLGYIAPNTWRLVKNGEAFRQFMLSDGISVLEIVQHTEQVFSDAVVDVDTVITQKNKHDETHKIKISIGDLNLTTIENSVSQDLLRQQASINLFLSDKQYALKEKLDKFPKVKDLLSVKNGVKPYEKGKGKPAQTAETLKEKPYTSETKLDDSFTPLIGGSNFHRYQLLWNNDNWIKYGEWLAAPRESEIFAAHEKLIFRQTSDKIIGCFIGKDFVMRNNTHIILPIDNSLNLKYVLSVLNSKLINTYYTMINPEVGETLAEVKAFHLESLPLAKISSAEQQSFIEKTDQMLTLNQALAEQKQAFIRLLQRRFNLAKISTKLQNWHDLSYPELTDELKKELKKNKAKLGMEDELELEKVFEMQKQKAQTLAAQIAQTDRAIDQAVYQLYGLTAEEISVVEG